MLTDDPIFGILNSFEIVDFFDPAKLKDARQQISQLQGKLVVVIGDRGQSRSHQDTTCSSTLTLPVGRYKKGSGRD